MRREVQFKANLAHMYLCVGPAFPIHSPLWSFKIQKYIKVGIPCQGDRNRYTNFTEIPF